MPEISVILPIYNAAKTLSQTLESLLCQRRADFEIIAVDDGSTDASSSILETYANKDKRIVPVKSDHAGLVTTLNLGIKQATGRFVARMDADDVSHPDRLNKQHLFLTQNPDIALISSRIQCFPRPQVAGGFRIYESWLNSLITPRVIAREIFIESPVVHPSIMMRHDSLKKVGGYRDFGWAEDYDLWLRLHQASYKMAKIPAVLHYWREHSHRLTRTDDRYSAPNFLKAKVHYLSQNPLIQQRTVIIWGSGQLGGRLSKQLVEKNISTIAFVDVSPKKIGSTRQDIPIIGPDQLHKIWSKNDHPLILSAVPSRGARGLIRQYLCALNMVEGQHFLCVA